MKTAIDKLIYLCDTVPDKLHRISEADAQFEDNSFIWYDQDNGNVMKIGNHSIRKK